jgi:recombination protein RecA
MVEEKKILSLDKTIDKLRKEYGKSLPDVLVAGAVKRLVLSSPKLNYIFGGGYPIGRITEFFGPESGGKTVLSCYIGGEVQKRKDNMPPLVIFVDMEHTFDVNYASTAGLSPDEDKLVFIHPKYGEEGFDICQRLIETGEVGLIIWDSIAETPSAAVMEDEYGKASFGATAKLFAEGLKKFNPYLSRYDTSMILLNQVRADIGGWSPHGGPAEKTTGGYAPKFYASWRGRVSRVEDIVDSKKTILGMKMRVKGVKSKIGIPKRSCELELYYATGFNPFLEYIDYFVELGIVDKAGSWYSYEGERLGQGIDSVSTYFHEHKDAFEAMKQTVNDSFIQHTVLDEKEQDDPVAEEEDKILGEE